MIPGITRGTNFAGLKDYLVEGRDHEVLRLAGVSTLENAPLEMALISALAPRAERAVIQMSFSAAPADMRLPASQWLSLANEVLAEFSLAGHQHLLIRHTDKDYDHVHLEVNAVSPIAFTTPPKSWHRRRDAPFPEIGQRALTGAQIATIPKGDRRLSSFDAFALARLQMICRTFERRHNLTLVSTPQEAAAARKVGQTKAARAKRSRRHDRAGSVPLTDRGDEIRCALNAPTWGQRRAAMHRIGLDLAPVFKNASRGGPNKGLIVFEVADPGNRVAASTFDTPDKKYGLQALDASPPYS